MPKKAPINWWLYTKVLFVGAAIIVGGPAFTKWVMPTDEELFKRYNPELQKKSLEGKERRQQDFDDFVTRLKQDSKSSKPIWTVQAEREKREREAKLQEMQRQAKDRQAIKQEIRKQAGLPSD